MRRLERGEGGGNDLSASEVKKEGVGTVEVRNGFHGIH
jgi:hypothetical protein